MFCELLVFHNQNPNFDTFCLQLPSKNAYLSCIRSTFHNHFESQTKNLTGAGFERATTGVPDRYPGIFKIFVSQQKVSKQDGPAVSELSTTYLI